MRVVNEHSYVLGMEGVWIFCALIVSLNYIWENFLTKLLDLENK